MCDTVIEHEGKQIDPFTLAEDDFNKLIEERQKRKWA